MTLYSCYKFYQLIDKVPEAVRRNPNHIEDGWLWGERLGEQVEIYPQFNQEEYFPIVQYLLQQAIINRGWSFGLVSPLPYPPKNYFATVYRYENTLRIDLGIGAASDLCIALLVAYVEAINGKGSALGS